MTESYKTPLTYTTIKVPDSFQTKRSLSNTHVCLITYANDNFYLNIPQVINEATGKYQVKKAVFQRWHNINRIDFNGWWYCDSDENDFTVRFKHFNTSQYMLIDTKNADNPIGFTYSKKNATTFILEPCDEKDQSLSDIYEKVYFKLRISDTTGEVKYLRVESVDQSNSFDEDTTRNKKLVVINGEDEI